MKEDEIPYERLFFKGLKTVVTCSIQFPLNVAELASLMMVGRIQVQLDEQKYKWKRHKVVCVLLLLLLPKKRADIVVIFVDIAALQVSVFLVRGKSVGKAFTREFFVGVR